MKMKIKILVAVLFLVSLWFVGFGVRKVMGPGEVCLKFNEALAKGNRNEAYSLLSAESKKAVNYKEYIAEKRSPFEDYFFEQTKFELVDIQIDKNRAIVKVKITVPDPTFLQMYFSEMAEEGKTEVEIVAALKQEPENTILMVSEENMQRLVREYGEWKVYDL